MRRDCARPGGRRRDLRPRIHRQRAAHTWPDRAGKPSPIAKPCCSDDATRRRKNRELIRKLLLRAQAVQEARRYRYVMFNRAGRRRRIAQKAAARLQKSDGRPAGRAGVRGRPRHGPRRNFLGSGRTAPRAGRHGHSGHAGGKIHPLINMRVLSYTSTNREEVFAALRRPTRDWTPFREMARSIIDAVGARRGSGVGPLHPTIRRRRSRLDPRRRRRASPRPAIAVERHANRPWSSPPRISDGFTRRTFAAVRDASRLGREWRAGASRGPFPARGFMCRAARRRWCRPC